MGAVVRGLAVATLVSAIATLPRGINAAEAEPPARERVPLSADWRFMRGDPEGIAVDLRYDELEPWIMPSGDAFIRDTAKRHVRPSGNPGADLAYVQEDFDDSGWERVTLPHDWAIEGPFIETGPHGGMGRLPSWGIGWYRKILDIPASDEGRSIFLDVEGAMSYATVWLNGRLAGGWPYGYNSWRLDLTPYVEPGGANQLAKRLDNPPSPLAGIPAAVFTATSGWSKPTRST